MMIMLSTQDDGTGDGLYTCLQHLADCRQNNNMDSDERGMIVTFASEKTVYRTSNTPLQHVRPLVRN